MLPTRYPREFRRHKTTIEATSAEMKRTKKRVMQRQHEESICLGWTFKSKYENVAQNGQSTWLLFTIHKWLCLRNETAIAIFSCSELAHRRRTAKHINLIKIYRRRSSPSINAKLEPSISLQLIERKREAQTFDIFGLRRFLSSTAEPIGEGPGSHHRLQLKRQFTNSPYSC